MPFSRTSSDATTIRALLESGRAFGSTEQCERPGCKTFGAAGGNQPAVHTVCHYLEQTAGSGRNDSHSGSQGFRGDESETFPVRWYRNDVEGAQDLRNVLAVPEPVNAWRVAKQLAGLRFARAASRNHEMRFRYCLRDHVPCTSEVEHALSLLESADESNRQRTGWQPQICFRASGERVRVYAVIDHRHRRACQPRCGLEERPPCRVGVRDVRGRETAEEESVVDPACECPVVGMTDNGWNSQGPCRRHRHSYVLFHHREHRFSLMPSQCGSCAPQHDRMKVHSLENRLEWNDSTHPLLEHTSRTSEHHHFVSALRESSRENLGDEVNTAPFERCIAQHDPHSINMATSCG